MRKLSVFLVAACLIIGSAQNLWAGSSFKFPTMIKYKLLKNDKIVGRCQFFYNKETKINGVSSLRLKNFEGLGFSSREWLFTYIFTDDSSIYTDFIMKGKNAISEIRLKKEALGFDGKKGKIFIYKDLESPDEMQTEIFTEYTVIDLLSMFFVVSKNVASGKEEAEKFNFLIDKSTKIVDMVPMMGEKVPFQGKEVDTHVFSFTYHDREIFRVKIFKDRNGFCFPVSVVIFMDFTNQKQSIELRADKVQKND
jgi:hypothetical protein